MELNMAISWEKFLEKEFSKDYFKALSSFIASERKENPNSIFPDENKVFEKNIQKITDENISNIRIHGWNY